MSETANNIRRRFRTRMDGVISENMRNKGVCYHINWGISLMHLRDLASDYEQDKSVAEELWQDNVRESRIMALLLMPVDEFTEEMAMQWVATLPTQEIAELAAMLLFCRLPYASTLCQPLISADKELSQILGFNLLSRLISMDKAPEMNPELLSMVSKACADDAQVSLPVRHAAHNCKTRIETLNLLNP